jgi:hypothetical protein
VRRQSKRSEDTVEVRCPYCSEAVSLYVDPDTDGSFVEDCSVCCRPWLVTVSRAGGELELSIERQE